MLNLDSLEWFLMKPKGYLIEHRRNHAAFLVGNMLYILGGIDGCEGYLTNYYAINLGY